MDKIEIEKRLEELSTRILPDGMSEDEKIEILSELDNLLIFAPDNTDILFWKAMVYECTNDYLNAVNIYTKILEIEPENKDIINSIKSCKELMLWSEKKTENIKASAHSPAKPSIMEKVSIWYILLGKVIILAIFFYFCFMK